MEADTGREETRAPRPDAVRLDLRPDGFEGVVAVEAKALAPVIWKEHDPTPALPAPPEAVSAFGKLSDVPPELHWNRCLPPAANTAPRRRKSVTL